MAQGQLSFHWIHDSRVASRRYAGLRHCALSFLFSLPMCLLLSVFMKYTASTMPTSIVEQHPSMRGLVRTVEETLRSVENKRIGYVNVGNNEFPFVIEWTIEGLKGLIESGVYWPETVVTACVLVVSATVELSKVHNVFVCPGIVILDPNISSDAPVIPKTAEKVYFIAYRSSRAGHCWDHMDSSGHYVVFYLDKVAKIAHVFDNLVTQHKDQKLFEQYVQTILFEFGWSISSSPNIGQETRRVQTRCSFTFEVKKVPGPTNSSCGAIACFSLMRHALGQRKVGKFPKTNFRAVILHKILYNLSLLIDKQAVSSCHEISDSLCTDPRKWGAGMDLAIGLYQLPQLQFVHAFDRAVYMSNEHREEALIAVPCCQSRISIDYFIDKYDSINNWTQPGCYCWNCQEKMSIIYLLSGDIVNRHVVPTYSDSDVYVIKQFRSVMSTIRKAQKQRLPQPNSTTPTQLTESTGPFGFPVDFTFWNAQIQVCRCHLLKCRLDRNKNYLSNDNLLMDFTNSLRYGIMNEYGKGWKHQFEEQARNPKVYPATLLKLLYPVSRNQSEDQDTRSFISLRVGQWVIGDVVSDYVSVLNYVANKGKHKDFFAVQSRHSDALLNPIPGNDLSQIRCGNNLLIGDLLSKYKRIGLPINLKYTHWVLTVLEPDLVNSRVDVFIYDSLGMSCLSPYSKLFHWLRVTMKMKNVNPCFLTCPKQADNNMCGVCTCRNLQEVMMMKGNLKEIKYNVQDIDKFRYIMLSRIVNHPTTYVHTIRYNRYITGIILINS